MTEQPKKKQQLKKWLTFSLRWGIAVVGIWWVLSQITWRDRVTLLDASNRPHMVRLADFPPFDAAEFHVYDAGDPNAAS